MVSVAFYFAFVDMEAFEKRFGVVFTERFKDEVKFVLDNELMEIRGNRIYLTDRGSDYINGVIPLFYSDRSKEELKTAFAKRKHSEASDEELFLSAYNIAEYDRPSVTTDIVSFAIRSDEEDSYRHNPKNHLSVLLIKRGEHPFMNSWALPGGFLRLDETIEQCAYREIREETNVTPAALMYFGEFSEPDRDPRGRIISNAFLSVISEDNVRVLSGDDAIDAKWFDVSFEKADNGECNLILKNEDDTLTATLREKACRFGKTEFEILDRGNVAFDHAKIIATALNVLRRDAKDFEIIFDFLPEKFTLTALQKVQETIMNISVIPANFRRKIAEYVVETDEYTTGAGHRPAKLFTRKARD